MMQLVPGLGVAGSVEDESQHYYHINVLCSVCVPWTPLVR